MVHYESGENPLFYRVFAISRGGCRWRISLISAYHAPAAGSRGGCGKISKQLRRGD